jgi:hypothetical protein
MPETMMVAKVGARGDRLPDRLDGPRSDDAEGIVRHEARPARRAQDRPHLVLHAVQPRHAVLRPHQDGEVPVRAQDLRHERDGHEHHLVAGLSQHAAQTLLDADDAHGIAAHEDRAAQRIQAREDLVLHVRADDRDRGRVLLLGRIEEAAHLEVEVEHPDHVRGVAGDLDAAELPVAGLHGRGLAGLRADRAARAAVGLDQPLVRARQRLAVVRHQELRPAADDPEAREDQDVGVQVHEVGRHELVEPADDRHDRHDRHDADDDAEQRQPRAELVASEGPKRRGEELSEAHAFASTRRRPPRTRTPRPSASPGSSP